MRTLGINRQSMYYATFLSKTEVLDEYGNPTGQYTITYNTPVLFRENVSASKGEAYTSQFGNDTNYDKVIVTNDLMCPIDENTVLWLGVPTTSPYNFIVKKVAKSVNVIAYAIAGVKVS